MQNVNTTPQLQKPQEAYTLSTPYGLVTIADNGRKVIFELHSDIRQSIHNTALFNYVQRLKLQGVTRWNTDHLHITGADRTMNLNRGKAKLDLVYEHRGKIIDCELKTTREIGLEVTARQLTELVKHCQPLHLLVPRGCLQDAASILTMLNIDRKVTIEAYDSLESDDNE